MNFCVIHAVVRTFAVLLTAQITGLLQSWTVQHLISQAKAPILFLAMGIYIIQILPAAKIRKYLYNLAELSLAEIILMCAAPGMLINAGVTRKSYQEKQGKYLNQRCFGFIYQDIQLQRQSSCIFKMGFVFSHCFVRVMAIRSFIKQIMCITLLDLLSRVFITPSRNKQTHMHTHRGLVGVNEELCCSIQQSISYICPNIMCTIT